MRSKFWKAAVLPVAFALAWVLGGMLAPPVVSVRAQIPSMSVPSPLRFMEAVGYGSGPTSFLLSTQPVLRASFQPTGFCAGGGTTATLNTAQTVDVPCQYPIQLTNAATSIVMTTLSTASNVATINILWSDGTTATATAPAAAGSSVTFTTATKSTNVNGFTLVVASSASLAANTNYSFQGTYATLGN